MKFKFVFLALIAALGYMIWEKCAAAGGPLGSVRSWQAAVDKAKATGKPVLLNFGGPW